MTGRQVERLLARLRKIRLALPESSERLSRGEPTFFVGVKDGKDGKVIARFNTRMAPDAPEQVAAIEKALG